MDYVRQTPGLADSIAKKEIFTQQWIKEHPDYGTRGVATIPIVVHVVYNPSYPEQNISDWQIKSQIDVLNEDYRKQNEDTTYTPAAFRPLTIDPEITFCLAQRDPNNNPTTGIERVSTSATIFADFASVKSSSSGGADPWPMQQYLNIWVCNMEGPKIGFATFPGGDPTQDGVVVHYAVFGRYQSTLAGYDLGRTCTHEIGHWLNLHHPWGDYESGCNTDYVDDTPTQDSADYGCLPFPNISCYNGPNGDMCPDYMNYSYDECSSFFTAGQKQRMWAAINMYRGTNISSDVCNPVVNYPLDIGVNNIYLIQSTTIADTVTPVLTITNYGSETVTNATINYQFYHQFLFTYKWTGNLSPGESVNVTLPKIRETTPALIFLAYTSSPNDGTDMNTVNDFHSFRGLRVGAVPPITIPGQANPIVVYPNPNNGNVTLSFDSTDLSSVSLLLYNTLGQTQLIKTAIQSENKILLDMTLSPSGLYFLKVSYKGKSYLEKLMRLPAY